MAEGLVAPPGSSAGVEPQPELLGQGPGWPHSWVLPGWGVHRHTNPAVPSPFLFFLLLKWPISKSPGA